MTGTWEDAIGDQSSEVQKIARWFFARYRNPCTEEETDEARDAGEIIDDKFGQNVSDDVVAEACEFIDAWGDSGEWVQRSEDSDSFTAAEEDTDPGFSPLDLPEE